MDTHQSLYRERDIDLRKYEHTRIQNEAEKSKKVVKANGNKES